MHGALNTAASRTQRKGNMTGDTINDKNIKFSTFIRMLQAHEKELGNCNVVSVGTSSLNKWLVYVETDEGEKRIEIPMYKRMY